VHTRLGAARSPKGRSSRETALRHSPCRPSGCDVQLAPGRASPRERPQRAHV